jgi:diguanylate cyclase (GGDEF)-like protein
MSDQTDTLVTSAWLKLGDAALRLGVSANTLRRWSDAGRVTCFRSPGGHRRYRTGDIDEVLRASARTTTDNAVGLTALTASSLDSHWMHTRVVAGDDTAEISGQAGHLHNLAVSTASGLNLPVAVVAWLIDDVTAAVVATHPAGIAPLGLLCGDVVSLRQIPLAEIALSQDRIVAIDDLSAGSPLSRRDYDYFHTVLGIRSAIAAPLHDGGLPRGILLAASPSSPHRFTAADTAFTAHLATQVAVACSASQVATAGPAQRLPEAAVKPHRAMAPDARVSDLPSRPQPEASGLGAGRRFSVTQAAAPQCEGPLALGLRAVCALLGGGAAMAVRGRDSGHDLPADVIALDPSDDGRSRALLSAEAQRLAPADSRTSAAATLSGDGDGSGVVIVPLQSEGTTLGHLLVAPLPGSTIDPDAADAVGPLVAALIAADDDTRSAASRNSELEAVIEATVEDRELLGYTGILHATARRLATLARAPVVDIYAVEGDVIRALVSYDNGRIDRDWEGVTLPLDRYPCSKAAVRTGKMANASSLDDPVLTPEGRSSLQKWGYQAQLSVPLMACGKVIGIAELSDFVPRDFRDEIDVVRRLADVAGQTLENAALFDEIQQRSRLTRELVELGTLVDRSHDEAGLAQAFAGRLREVIDVARCDVFALRDGDLERRASSEARGEDLPSAALSDRPIPLTDCPSTEQALKNNQLLLISDPGDPRLSTAEREAFNVSGYRSEAVVPLYSGGGAFGIIDLLDTRPRDYTEYVDFLRSAGQALQTALDQFRLLGQLERRSGILRDVVELGALAAELHAADLGQLLGAVVERLTSTLQAKACDIFIMEGDGLHCRVSFDERGFDESVVGNILPLGKYPTTTAALKSGEPFVIASLDDPRLTDEELDNYAEYGFQSEMGIPLMAGEKVVGFLDIFDTRPRDYAEHIDFARSLGQIVAGSLDNALLLERLNRGVHEQRLLVESALDFGASLDPERVLRAVAGRACDLGEADICEIAVVDGDQARVLASVSTDGDTGGAGSSYPLSEFTMIAATVSTAQPQWRYDIHEDTVASVAERTQWARWGVRSSVKVPLLVRGEAIGVVSLIYRQPRTPDHIELLQGLAQIAAQALANADLYNEVQAGKLEAERLNALARRITASLDPREISRLAVDELHGLVDFDVAAVVLVEGEDASFAYVTPPIDEAFADDEFDHAELAALCTATAVGVTRQTLTGDEPVLRRHASLNAVRSLATVSLRDAERPIGVLQVATYRPDSFSDRDVSVLERVGTHIGIALTNARLYSSIKRLHLGNLRALSSALSAKDHYTLGHAARVAAYMVLLGRELAWPPDLIDQVEEAAYLHDVGKIGISDRILLTAAPLNAREWELMRQHPAISADILEPLFDKELVAGVRHHHERFDGSGYPSGLIGEQIPEIARAMCVVDAYDAMSYRRPYRGPLTYQQCRVELERCSGTHFDPLMVRAFERVLDDLDGLRVTARSVAEQAAARIDADEHVKVALAMSADVPEYGHIAETLAGVLQENPGTRFLVTLAAVEEQFVIIVDPTNEQDEAQWSPPGEAVAGAGELAADFAGDPVDQNVLCVDRFGVWVYATAPIRNAEGEIVALTSADMSLESRQHETHSATSDVKESFASMLHTTAEQLGRARLDAITDYLTGIYNHRYLHERLHEEMERAREAAMPLSLLFLDIDQFKEFNDTYGHSLGDTALRAVAAAIDGAIRRVDLAARYGGEEFVVVLVDTDGAGALEAAERVRAAIAGTEIAAGVHRISVSVGVATFPEDAEFKEELIDKADWAMYMAKRSGRNRVSAFSSGQLRLDLGDATAGRTT